MSGSIRLFVTAPLAAGAEVVTTAAQAHHLSTVMRRASGDPVRLFNGRDGEWLARIGALRRDGVILTVKQQLRAQQTEPDLWLVFALLKRDATDLVVQKATELGVAAIHPVLTERTNVARVNEGRLAAIAIAAAEQSERLMVPEIHALGPLSRLLGSWPKERRLFVAAERRPARPVLPAALPAALLVGPEGGFSERELDDLDRLPFVQLVSFGPRILRAETAAVAGLALLQAHGGG